MRGKVLVAVELDFLVGITPAYAGKSQNGICNARLEWDHPRLCGEKSGNFRRNNPHTGSPPPMRGKEQPKTGIPDKFEDHPRLCGEKQIISGIIM